MEIPLKDILELIRAVDRLWHGDVYGDTRRTAELLTAVRFAANRIETRIELQAPNVKVLEEERNV